MDTLLLIDGNAIMYRAYFALPPFKTKDGTPTNAIYGFFTMLYKALADFKPNYLVVCFDTPKPTFRQKLYKEYQIQRPKIEDEFRIQIPIIKNLLKKAGVYQIEKDGFEADDLIGTITHIAKKEGKRTMILSGDKDIMQLIDGDIFVATPQIGFSQAKIYDRDEIIKTFKISPEQIADFKALVGDPSDNYPGVKGIGPKTAVKLLHEYQTLEHLMSNLDKLSDEKLKLLLKKNKKLLVLSKKLSYIVTNLKIKFRLKYTQYEGFKKELKNEFLKLEMRSLATRFFEVKKTQVKKETKKSSADPQINLF